VLLWVSLGLNVLLAVFVMVSLRKSAPMPSIAEAEVQAAEGVTNSRTHLVVRRPGFHWSEVESPDFAAYIKNLRNIGTPEKTIRDIIVAEVNELYADRMARELNLPQQKWWQPDPDMDALQAGMDQVRTLEGEKAQLLTQLLGAGWETQKLAAESAIRFDGAVLAQVAPEMRGAVERIEAQARQSRNALEAEARQQGRELSEQELARLRQETRRELAAVLTPQQLEEYLLRYSNTADQLRDQLRGFGADANEFRRIFRARDGYDQQIAAVTGVDDASVARRNELARARDEAVRQAIGQERFALYQLTQSPYFREAQEAVEQSGGAAEKVLPVMRINQAVADEIARIRGDQNLTEDQRRVALAAVEQQQRNSIDRVLNEQPADPIAEAEATAQQTAEAQRAVEAPPMPLLPGAVGTFQPSREGLPPGADLPPGFNETTKGPGYRGSDPTTVHTPPAIPPPTAKGPAYPPRRR
jgi:hypothetical protein